MGETKIPLRFLDELELAEQRIAIAVEALRGLVALHEGAPNGAVSNWDEAFDKAREALAKIGGGQ